MPPRVSVSEFIALTNQTLEFAYPTIEVEGEVASFKVNQQKYIFFDIKDASGTIGCFMTVWQMRMPVEDGMKVIVTASPKLTQWGKFSLTVKAIRPSGEGSLKKSFLLLKKKLDDEGIFAPERKRALPSMPRRIAIIASTQSAGYADFIKIINERWGGVEVIAAHVQVQGDAAPDQVIRALDYFNQDGNPVDVVVILRGGGSADDLSAFNDEKLVRAVAASRIPTVVAIGHEIDESLAELAADVRGSTPSHAAQIIVPDRQELLRSVAGIQLRMSGRIQQAIVEARQRSQLQLRSAIGVMQRAIELWRQQLQERQRVIRAVDPRTILERGYAIVRGEARVGEIIAIETSTNMITAEIQHVTKNH